MRLEGYVGTYKLAASSNLDLQGWNAGHQIFEYTLSRPLKFRYERHAFVEAASLDITYYGAIVAEDMSPKIQVCALRQNPWPEMFKMDAHMARLSLLPICHISEIHATFRKVKIKILKLCLTCATER